MATTPAAPPPSGASPGVPDRRIDRGALTASVITAAFGTAWALWGASGLPSGPRGAVRVVSVLVGLILIARSLRLRRGAPSPPRHTVRSPAFRTTVGLEILAIIAGVAALDATDRQRYVPAWVALVVGTHLLVFGRVINRGYYPLGAAVAVGGLAAALVGLTGGTTAAVDATAGLVAATSLLSASAVRVLRYPP